jgi:hypothetical protein
MLYHLCLRRSKKSYFSSLSLPPPPKKQHPTCSLRFMCISLWSGRGEETSHFSLFQSVQFFSSERVVHFMARYGLEWNLRSSLHLILLILMFWFSYSWVWRFLDFSWELLFIFFVLYCPWKFYIWFCVSLV